MNFFKTSLGIVSVGVLSSAVAGTYFLSSGKKEDLGFSNSLSTQKNLDIPVLESSHQIVENVPELVFENSESTSLVDIPLTEKVAEVDLLDTEINLKGKTSIIDSKNDNPDDLVQATDDIVEDDSDIAAIIPDVPVKSDFVGKLIFFEELKNTEIDNYGSNMHLQFFIHKFKFLNIEEYNSESSKYNEDIGDDDVTYDKTRIIIDISHTLNLEETKNKLDNIFEIDNFNHSKLPKLKEIVLEKAKELKELLGHKNYENMKNKFSSAKEK